MLGPKGLHHVRALAQYQRVIPMKEVRAQAGRPLAPYVHLEASSDAFPARVVGQIGLRLAAQL